MAEQRKPYGPKQPAKDAGRPPLEPDRPAPAAEDSGRPLLEPYGSAAAVRDANRPLLDRLAKLGDSLPEDFLAEIENFRVRSAAAGRVLSSPEDRGEVQSAVNFWTTVLLASSRRPRSIVLEKFDADAARARVGDTPPYKGLEAFQIEDSDKFFGRHATVAQMLRKLAKGRLLAVLGLSGSGKSSVVRAGLIPQLRDGDLPGSADWMILDPVLPGRSPLDALAEIARRVGADPDRPEDPSDFLRILDGTGRRVLVSVDQFEELFTLGAAEEDRQLFLDCLTHAATHGRHEHVVLLTMRSEYDSYVRRYGKFEKLFEAGRVPIAALSAKELRAAVEQPAAQAGVGFEPGFADELVQSVVGEPAALPLLQFTLLELWSHRSDPRELKRIDYQKLGGSPREILANKADQILDSFALEQDRTLTRRIFLALVGSGLEPTSRRLSRAELDSLGSRDSLDRVLAVWRDHGLIRISPAGVIGPTSQVEVTHEALIRNWGQLEKWIEKNIIATRSRRVLNEQAHAWAKGKDTLLGEVALSEWEPDIEDLEPLERDYVLASRAEVDRKTRAIQTRNRIAAMAMLAGLVLLLVGGWQTNEARVARLELVDAEDKQHKAERERAALADLRRRDEMRYTNALEARARAQRQQLARALASERERAEKALAVLQRRQAVLVAEYARLQNSKKVAQADIDVAEARLAEANKRVGEAETRLAAAEREYERKVEVAEAGRAVAEAEKASAELQTAAARNIGQQVVAAIGRRDLVVAAAAGQPAETRTVRERMPTDLTRRRARAPLGLPDAPLVVDRRFYTVGFDPAVLSPRWVAFTVDTRSTLRLRRSDIRPGFDPDIPRAWQTGEDAYRNNSYDRGHLVRLADARVGPSEADARASEAEISYYSVTVPQADQTNRTTWLAVEQYTTELSARLGQIHVVAGPVYPDTTASNGAYLALGRSRTAVPLYLYRVLLRREADGGWRSLAFLVPNDGSISRDPLQFVTSVSDIETLTGLRFFTALPASEAAALKSNASPAAFAGPAADQTRVGGLRKWSRKMGNLFLAAPRGWTAPAAIASPRPFPTQSSR